MKTRTLLVVTMIGLFLPGLVFGQQAKTPTSPSVVIAYLENNSGNLAVYDKNKQSITFDIGTKLAPGSTVVTDAGDLVELKLDPNGSIIKISQMTNFTVESLQTAPTETNTFSMALGKVRMVAGRATGQEKYALKGPSAVCGVRGTDFGMDVSPTAEDAFVLDGLIDFTKNTGETVQIAAGQMADALAPAFAAVAIPQDFLDSVKKDLDFQKLAPTDVAGHGQTQAAPAATPAPAPTQAQVVPPPKPPEAKPAAGQQGAAAPAKPGPLDAVMDWIRKVLGAEVGSLTVDQGGVTTTYSKVVLAPEFAIGPMKLGLYLPIIYTGDMFNPADYYRPGGNDEWNFGFTKGKPWDALDALDDLMLKIKYFEWGTQRDPFFVKVGNLDDITIGHGLIMKDFANDADFPAVRRVGLNLGMDLGGFGFEGMVNDAAQPDIVGGRIYVRPIPNFKLAIGLSLLADLDPTATMDPVTAQADGMPMFFNGGIDLDLPFISTPALSIIAFGDVANMVPYFQVAPTGVPSQTGAGFPPSFTAFTLDNYLLHNYGMAAGLLGNILMVNYRLEYRYFTGTFQPAFYNTIYERTRGEYVDSLISYLQNPSAYANKVTMGVYGEGGFTLEKILTFKMGYMWPWSYVGGVLTPSDDDHFLAQLTLEKGVIPVVNISGSISYERTHFVPTLLKGTQNGLGLFDANTAMTAQLVYSVAPTLDVDLLYTLTPVLDANGAVVPDPNNLLLPQMTSTIGIETSIHF